MTPPLPTPDKKTLEHQQPAPEQQKRRPLPIPAPVAPMPLAQAPRCFARAAFVPTSALALHLMLLLLLMLLRILLRILLPRYARLISLALKTARLVFFRACVSHDSLSCLSRYQQLYFLRPQPGKASQLLSPAPVRGGVCYMCEHLVASSSQATPRLTTAWPVAAMQRVRQGLGCRKVLRAALAAASHPLPSLPDTQPAAGRMTSAFAAQASLRLRTISSSRTAATPAQDAAQYTCQARSHQSASSNSPVGA